MSDNTYSSDSLRIITIMIMEENILRMKRYFLILMTTGQTFIVQFIFWRSLNICLNLKKTLEENGKHMCQISIFFSRELKTWMGSLPQHFI